MVDPPRNTRLAEERFVALTTFRRDGTPVPTTVWVAEDGADLVVTTPAGSGKVKRLRHDPRVRLVPSSRRGQVPPGATPVDGSATIVDPAEDPDRFARLSALFPAKYGLEYRAMMVIEKVVTRGKGADRFILLIRT